MTRCDHEAQSMGCVELSVVGLRLVAVESANMAMPQLPQASQEKVTKQFESMRLLVMSVSL